MTHTLADGCCSAVTPCSWQRKNHSTICDTCRAASLSVSVWLESERRAAHDRSGEFDKDSLSEVWHKAQAAAFDRARTYAVARPDRSVSPTPVPEVPDADLTYLAGLAISSKDATLARIAAALLLAR